MAEAQVFVKIDEYKNILRTIGLIKSRINDAKNTLQRVRELKSQEDAELSGWDGKIVDIEKKIEAIDQIMFEPGSI